MEPCYRLYVISVYLAQDLQDAELLQHRLSERGIPSTIHNGFLQGALGELPLSVRPEVCVRDAEDYEAARSCVAEMEAANKSVGGADLRCPKCGEDNPDNFELCWSCRAELTRRTG